MIHNVYVFDESGVPLVSIKVGSVETDSVLLTGFLSAIQSFSKKVNQGEVERINIKDYDFHIRKVEEVYVAFATDRDEKEVEQRLGSVCSIIANNIKKLTDREVSMRIKDAVTKKISVADRAKNWAEIGL